MLSDDAPSQIPDDFGFYYDLETVQLCAMALNRFHVLPYPGGFLDQPFNLIMDVVRYLNLMDAVHDSDQTFHPTDSYEDQSFESIIKPISL